MQILNVTYHEWTNVMSSGKVKLIKCTCCNPPRYTVLKSNTPLFSTYHKDDALAIYFNEKNKGDEEDVL